MPQTKLHVNLHLDHCELVIVPFVRSLWCGVTLQVITPSASMMWRSFEYRVSCIKFYGCTIICDYFDFGKVSNYKSQGILFQHLVVLCWGELCNSAATRLSSPNAQLSI